MRKMLLASFFMSKFLKNKAEKEILKYAEVETAFTRIKTLTVILFFYIYREFLMHLSFTKNIFLNLIPTIL